MNLQNFRLEPSATTPGDWIVFGDIYDTTGNLIGTFGDNGTSVFGWWALQDSVFQQNYCTQFSVIMAQEIVTGAAE